LVFPIGLSPKTFVFPFGLSPKTFVFPIGLSPKTFVVPFGLSPKTFVFPIGLSPKTFSSPLPPKKQFLKTKKQEKLFYTESTVSPRGGKDWKMSKKNPEVAQHALCSLLFV
jgi:hypothetical protein